MYPEGCLSQDGPYPITTNWGVGVTPDGPEMDQKLFSSILCYFLSRLVCLFLTSCVVNLVLRMAAGGRIFVYWSELRCRFILYYC